MKTLILLKFELIENGTSDLHQIMQEDSSWHCPQTKLLKNYIFFVKFDMVVVADENTNSTKELNNVKMVRPISQNLVRRIMLPNATIYTMGTLKRILQQKLMNLNLNKYVSDSIANRQLMGACVQC